MADDLPQIESHLHRRLEADILERGCIIPVVVTKDNQVIAWAIVAGNERSREFGETS